MYIKCPLKLQSQKYFPFSKPLTGQQRLIKLDHYKGLSDVGSIYHCANIDTILITKFSLI